MTRLSRRLALTGLCCIGLASAGAPAALAQAAPSARIRGTILSFDGSVLTVATRQGPEARITLAQPLVVAALRRVALAEITNGSSLGVVAEPGPDGNLRATAITVLPPGVRITELQTPWDTSATSSMNNGAVTAILESSSGRTVTLSILGRSVPVVIDAETPLVMPIPATTADLKPGAPVLLNAVRAADGSLSTLRVTVGKDGVAPPT